MACQTDGPLSVHSVNSQANGLLSKWFRNYANCKWVVHKLDALVYQTERVGDGQRALLRLSRTLFMALLFALVGERMKFQFNLRLHPPL